VYGWETVILRGIWNGRMSFDELCGMLEVENG